MIDRLSPNRDERPEGCAIDILLLHYTGMESAAAALERLRDRRAEVSAHYLIDEEGAIYRLVEERERAWHAGKSFWQGARNINARSIGIELVNPGHEFGYRPFSEAQMIALLALAKAIVNRHSIPLARVLGHSDVAPLRKKDPGELFDWPRLAVAGIGLWPIRPAASTAATAPPWDRQQDERFVANLARFGYDVEGTPESDREEAKKAAIIAFCRHFRPHNLSETGDGELAAILDSLLQTAFL